MPDKPTPNPSDPDKPEPGSPDHLKKQVSPASRLRLKRVVIEDTEIKPSEDKNWEPTPESQPYEEPQEEPVSIEPIPLTPEQIGELPPEVAPIPPDEDDDEDDDDEDDEDEEVSEKKPLSPAARLAVILVPAVMIVGIMIFVLRTYDPFGDGLRPFAANQIPADLLKGPNAQTDENQEAENGLAGTTLDTPRTSLQGFLSALQEQPLTASISPRGVFIDSVFIPEGAALNKQIGVVFSNLLIENDKALIVVTSPDGTKLALPAQVNLR